MVRVVGCHAGDLGSNPGGPKIFSPWNYFTGGSGNSARGGGGGTLIFSHIRRLGPFLGFKILNFNIFGVFRKINIFGGYEDFVDIFGGHHKIGLV